jgi:hypothetical protein
MSSMLVIATTVRLVGLTDLAKAWVEGKRQFPSRFHGLSHVKVLSEALARRVTSGRMNGSLVATDVDLVDSCHVLANIEVIICSGFFHTPEILMLSGIGDRTLLQQHFDSCCH